MRASTAGTSEGGFTLIELLVVILIIGILAAIAIPVFLSQKGKAIDASGKEDARAAAQAAVTYSTDHNGEFTGFELKSVHEYEPALQIAEGNHNAYVSAAEPKENNKGFRVAAVATSGDTFVWTQSASGAVTRTCELGHASSYNTTGCANGSW